MANSKHNITGLLKQAKKSEAATLQDFIDTHSKDEVERLDMFISQLPQTTAHDFKELVQPYLSYAKAYTPSSGAGGQKTNKTESAFELLFAPLNLQIKAHEHRNQKHNEKDAYEKLRHYLNDHSKQQQSRKTKLPQNVKQHINAMNRQFKEHRKAKKEARHTEQQINF